MQRTLIMTNDPMMFGLLQTIGMDCGFIEHTAEGEVVAVSMPLDCPEDYLSPLDPLESWEGEGGALGMEG